MPRRWRQITAGEGEVRYDILFYAFIPGKQRIKVIINVEAQQEYTPGYELATRGIFYGARMLSAQYGTEFVSPHYDDVKKVYSVWICMDAPQYAAYTVTRYHIAKEELYGHLGKETRYDLLEVIMVCLGKEEDVSCGNRLHGMLSTLFSARRKPEEKERILEQEYEIQTSVEMEGGMQAMSNLGLWIEEKATKRGMEKGMKKGVQEGRREGLAAVVRSLKGFVGSFDELYTLVIKNEVYKDVTREEVLEYYSRT